MAVDPRLKSPRFPRASKYNPDWILACVSGGANSLWLTEWLTADLDLKPGMRVLDLGCGRAASSIFLAREFGVQVWATDGVAHRGPGPEAGHAGAGSRLRAGRVVDLSRAGIRSPGVGD